LTEGGAKWVLPLVLLALVAISYFTRPASRRVPWGTFPTTRDDRT
jgi:hypothetical protein